MPNRRQAIIWTDADPIQWSIYAALGGGGGGGGGGVGGVGGGGGDKWINPSFNFNIG